MKHLVPFEKYLISRGAAILDLSTAPSLIETLKSNLNNNRKDDVIKNLTNDGAAVGFQKSNMAGFSLFCDERDATRDLKEKTALPPPIGKFYERGGGLLVSLASSANTRKVDIRTIKRSVSL